MKRGTSQILLQPDALFRKYSAGFQLVEEIREICTRVENNVFGGGMVREGTSDRNGVSTDVLQRLWVKLLEQVRVALRALGVFVLFEYANRWVLP